MIENRDNFPELPKGWTWTLVQEVIKIIDYRGRTPPFSPNGIPHIRSSNVKNGKIIWEDLKYVSEETYKEFMTRGLPQRGDILFTTEGPLGEVALAPEEKFSVAQRMMILRPNKNVLLSEFLLYQIASPWFQAKLKGEGTGSTVTGISSRNFQPLEIVTAPLNEQRRLVTKIESLKARTARVKDSLSTIPALLDQFRQSVLAAAFRGALTADWREQNPDVEPADVLLEKIRVERGKRYQEECSKAEIEGRRKPTPFKENLEPIELSNLPVIPDTWCWERLVNISNTIGGVTKGRKLGNRQTIMLPYLRVANVQDGYLDLSEIKEIEVLPEDLNKYHLEYGDILFTEGGDRDKLGRGTIWTNNIENCIHQNHVYRARLYYSGVSCDYISLATKSKYARAYFFANASQTVNLASINLTCLGNLPLPIPSEKEQKEIVHRVQLLFKVADTIEQQYKQSFGAIDQLDQSILAQAFRGALVSQDPNDEPASVLLERIRAEREKNTGATSKHSKKSKAVKESIQMELELE